MTTMDPDFTEIIRKNLLKVRFIWFTNIAGSALVYFILCSLQFTPATNVLYIHYVLGLLAFSELIVAVIMRKVRFKPALIKTLESKGAQELARNFFTVEIITIALVDSILVYGAVGYILLSDVKLFRVFALITLISQGYFFPRESTWMRSYEESKYLKP